MRLDSVNVLHTMPFCLAVCHVHAHPAPLMGVGLVHLRCGSCLFARDGVCVWLARPYCVWELPAEVTAELGQRSYVGIFQCQ